MSVLGSSNRTLLDVAKNAEPDGTLPKIVELLSKQNAILDDIAWKEGNQTDGHKSSIRTGLPTVIWRKMYQGVPSDKSSRATVTDTCGMMEARSEIDVDLANLNGNAAEFRLEEDMAFLEAMNQEFSKTLFYGSEVKTPESFTGFAPRYSDSKANNGDNILCANQSTAAKNSSIWLIAWDDMTIHGIYPKGTKAGWQSKDLGEIDATDSDGNKYRAYATQYKWKCGLTVRDWRYAVRIIFDSSALKADRSSGADLTQLMEIAQERIQSLNIGRLGFYMNKRTAEFLRLQLGDKAKYQLTRETVAGKRVTVYGDTPVRICEAITNTETKVNA